MFLSVRGQLSAACKLRCQYNNNPDHEVIVRMSNATVAAAPSMDLSNRRLIGGLIVSLLLHAVVLSLGGRFRF